MKHRRAGRTPNTRRNKESVKQSDATTSATSDQSNAGNGLDDRTASPSKHLVLPISGLTLMLLLLVIITPSIMLLVTFPLPSRPIANHEKPAKVKSVFAAGATIDPVDETDSGWGRLEYSTITISPPLEFIEEMDVSKVGNHWHFRESDLPSLDELLTGFGVTEKNRHEILELRDADDADVIPVTNELLRKIPLSTRGKIYGYLANDERNRDQYNAFRFCGESADQWFENSGLRSDLVDQVKSMVYSNGTVHFFADLRLVISDLSSVRERMQLLKVLSRESTVLAKLRVEYQSDVERLVDYWGRYGRAKDVRPILDSFASRREGGMIDIVHLLPAFARERLYTYPGTRERQPGRPTQWSLDGIQLL